MYILYIYIAYVVYIYIYTYIINIHQAMKMSPPSFFRDSLMVATVQMNGTRIAHLQRQQKEGHLHGKLTSIHLRSGERGWRRTR
jgi:arginyl-tRNA--protein-N-Asp/Glu arginylyltransferase